MADDVLGEPIRIRFEGRDADNHELEMSALADFQGPRENYRHNKRVRGHQQVCTAQGCACGSRGGPAARVALFRGTGVVHGQAKTL